MSGSRYVIVTIDFHFQIRTIQLSKNPLANSHLPYLNSVIRTLPQQPNEQFCSATSIFATLVCSFHICQKKPKRKVFPLQYQFCHSYCVKASKQLLFILGELCFQLHFVLSSCSAISNNTSSVISREKAKKKGSFPLYSFSKKTAARERKLESFSRTTAVNVLICVVSRSSID